MVNVLTVKNLHTVIPIIKKHGKLVLVGGCFDILHPGHISFLKYSKKTGDRLLVMLESDKSITKNKGPRRPIYTQKKRAQNLLNISYVDYVLLLPELKTDKDYYEMTKLIQPDIIAVTKGDPAFVKKKQQAEIVGGKIVEVINRISEHSTTNIINKHI